METENIRNCDKLEKYKIAVDLIKYEGETLWQIMNTFMIVNTIYIGFIASTISTYLYSPFRKFEPIYMTIGIVGLIIAIAWLGTFIRNSNYYHFRMAQAKEYEPDDLELLKGRGEEFAKGCKIEFKNEKNPYQNKNFAKWMRNKRAGFIIIFTFIGIYFLLIICSIPFCCSH